MGASAYTKERLEAAAHGARTWSEALEGLGVDPKSSTRRYVLGRMKKLGVDVSHFEREGVKWTREVLEQAVSASTNMCEVLRRLDLDVVGGHHTHIGRRVKAYGIDTSHFRSPTQRGKARSVRTPTSSPVEQPVDRARRVPGDRLRRAMLAEGLEEVIAFLNVRPYATLQRHLFKRFRDFGIDVSHFSAHGRRPRPRSDDLREAVTASRSIAEALRHLDRPDNHRQRALLRQWIAEESISTAHFLGQGHRRGKRSHNAKGHDAILVRHEGKRRTGAVLLRRALREVGVPDECAGCGVGPQWLGKPMTLEADHVNGDWSDDRRENLRLLCPNCHAITNTWCRGRRCKRPR
ncbi:hypothetical protein [Streptomyces sp. NPDC002250]|uniref:hypothetical protein n=1 Tax=Streptomyces sp. NPDC002250 TaxID=3364641 RepID=UPI0036CB0C1D